MTARTSILTIGLLFAFAFKVPAQDKLIEKYKVSLWFGVRDVSRDSLKNNDNLDFMNYLHSSQDMAEYQYLGISTHLWFRGDWEADIKIAMFDGFAPDNINLKAQYFPLKNLGLSLGFYSFPQLLNDFSTYHRINDVGFYGDLDNNFRQRSIHETGLMVGLVLPIDYRFFHCAIQLNGGISSMSTFKETVDQKQINSNLRREIHYKTLKSLAPFLFPEIEFNIDCFNFNNVKCGIQIQSNLYFVNRSIDYNRTTYEWTIISPDIERIDNPIHHFEKWELDFGIYLRW